MIEFEQPSSLNEKQGKRWNIIKQFRPLITTLRVVSSKQLAPLLRASLDQFDESLFDMSDNATSNDLQVSYFDLMRQVKAQRENLESTFFHRINLGFEHFVQGKVFDETAEKAAKLSLVDNKILETSIAGKRIISHALSVYAKEISAINQRFAVISGGVQLGEDNPNLPSSPAHIILAFEHAIHTLSLEKQEVVVLAFKCFEQHLVNHLAPFYQSINEQLIRAKILPNLKIEEYSKPIITPSSQGRRDEPSQLVKKSTVPISSDELEKLRAINQVLESRTGIEDLIVESTGGVARADQVLNSLSQIQAQNQKISSLESEVNSLEENLSLMEEMKLLINQQLHQGKSDNSSAGDIVLSGGDANKIDLVGMMFDYVLNDSNIPGDAKALMSRLHTPFLKVALMNKEFLHADNPARQLLNLMAETANKNQMSKRDELGVFSQLEKTVMTILSDFKEDLGIFDNILDDFKSFTTTLEKKRGQIEKRAVESVKGQEDLKAARASTARAIYDATINANLPKAMLSILRGPWANLLVLTLLPKSKVSGRWDSCFEVVDQMVSLQVDTPEDWPHQLQIIRGRVKKGLEVIGFPESETMDLLTVLGQWQPGQTPDASLEVQPELVREEDKVQSEHQHALSEQLKTLSFGTWFEFNADQDENFRQRVKLAWYSTGTANFMFVNQAGAKVGVKSLSQLVEEVELGKSCIIEQDEKPFVDRALSFVLKKLKSEP
ncbi:MAG: DUF1631 family protein [Methylococcales bacterium]|jgi:hypothetical protein|nr:DUF1631 family protein [Methylococcales bacterium]MBT7446032.1 DUF1631 family protein [Methylococcales bacterium]